MQLQLFCGFYSVTFRTATHFSPTVAPKSSSNKKIIQKQAQIENAKQALFFYHTKEFPTQDAIKATLYVLNGITIINA